MTTKSSDVPSAPTHCVAIERWAVERLDRDAGFARVEWVPMRPEFVSDELATTVLDTGVQVGMDKLSRWDVSRVEIRKMSLRRLIAELGLRHEEQDALSENMVFWVLRGAEKEPYHVVHATRAARETAKHVYHEAVRKEDGKHEGE